METVMLSLKDQEYMSKYSVKSTVEAGVKCKVSRDPETDEIKVEHDGVFRWGLFCFHIKSH